MEEIWKDIKGYEGLYQVSNLGRVKSLKRVILRNNQHGKYFVEKEEKILKQFIQKKGYLRISLSQNGESKFLQVHRLVAQAFINNPDNKETVNHINGIKTDNSVKNLEWCTNAENLQHSYMIGLRKSNDDILRKNREKQMVKINQYTLDGKFIKKWESLNSIQRELGYPYGNIARCCNGVYKKSHGYKWKFA